MGISVHLGKGQALKDLMCALLRRSYCSIWRSFRMMWHATCWSSLFFSLEIAKNARVHSPQIFHCYCFTLQAFRLILTICLVRFVNLFANELFDLSHTCFCSFFVCVCFLRTEFLAFHKQKACYFRVTIFVGINREKRACIYIPAGMARDYSSFNLEVCQNKEHQQ